MLYFDQIVELSGSLVNSVIAGEVGLEQAKNVIRDYNHKDVTYRSTGEQGVFSSRRLMAEFNKLVACGLLLKSQNIHHKIHGSSIYSKPEGHDQTKLAIELGLTKDSEGFYSFHFSPQKALLAKGIKWVRKHIND